MYQGAADGWQNENVFLMIAHQLAPGLVDDAQSGQGSLEFRSTGQGHGGVGRAV